MRIIIFAEFTKTNEEYHFLSELWNINERVLKKKNEQTIIQERLMVGSLHEWQLTTQLYKLSKHISKEIKVVEIDSLTKWKQGKVNRKKEKLVDVNNRTFKLVNNYNKLSIIKYLKNIVHKFKYHEIIMYFVNFFFYFFDFTFIIYCTCRNGF